MSKDVSSGIRLAKKESINDKDDDDKEEEAPRSRLDMRIDPQFMNCEKIPFKPRLKNHRKACECRVF